MFKKLLILSVLMVACFYPSAIFAQTTSDTLPASAQTESQPVVKRVGSFFSRVLGISTENPTSPTGARLDKRPLPSGMSPLPVATGSLKPLHEKRLQNLVDQGKITPAQKAAILAKLKAIQAELRTWAKAQKLDESYVTGESGSAVEGTQPSSETGNKQPSRELNQKNRLPIMGSETKPSSMTK